jgi:hypothetical protein
LVRSESHRSVLSVGLLNPNDKKIGVGRCYGVSGLVTSGVRVNAIKSFYSLKANTVLSVIKW